MVVNGTPRRIVIGKHAPLATGLRYIKYRVKDIEDVIFPGQSHGLGQRRPDNQFLILSQIGLILQELQDYIVDIDSDSMRPDRFSLSLLFIAEL